MKTFFSSFSGIHLYHVAPFPRVTYVDLTIMPILSSSTAKQHRRNQKSQKILVVDDNVQIRKILCQLLETDGYQVDSADDGDTGIKKFLQMRPDLIIADIYMPRVPGTQMIADIKSTFPDAKVIVLSGGSGRSKTTYPIDESLGINKVLSKPITREALQAAVDSVLNQAC